MPEDKFEFESLQDSTMICNYLRSIIEGLESGKIRLATEGDEIVLNPEGLIKVVVKARKKPLSSKMTIKLSWKDEKSQESGVDSSIRIVAS